MKSSFNNPWFEVILEQMWIARQTTSMVARSIDTELLGDPQALTDYCLNPTEKRLNPLEFHGKRRVPRAPYSRSGNPEPDALSHAQDGQPRGPSASYEHNHQGRSHS